MKRYHAIAIGLIAAGIVVLAATSPAHAISAGYRAQLERSGCTQVSDLNKTCNVNKTKAQNEAESKKAAAFPDQDILDDVVYGADIADAAEVLLKHHWKPNNGWWSKNGRQIHLNVTSEKRVGSIVRK